MKRQRGRNRRNNSNSNNSNRSMESNGPDVKVRGTAKQIFDKYEALANDAASSGQRVKAENFRQHAEHYQRILNAIEAAKLKAQEEAEQKASTEEASGSSEEPSSDKGQEDINDGSKSRRRSPRSSKRDSQSTKEDSLSEDTTEVSQETSEEEKALAPKSRRRKAPVREDVAKDEAAEAEAAE